MIVLEDSFKVKLEYDTYVALGSFDGLHKGHMSLINKVIELAKKNGKKSMVYTFKNHPLTVINKEIAPKLLMDNETKSEILDALGIDIVNFVPFDNEFMRIQPEDFIHKLISHYNVKGIVVGFNWRFGYKNMGDTELLKKLSKDLGFELYVMESVKYDEEIVSSSNIRNLIVSGNVKDANKLLLRPYLLRGLIVKGKQLGRTIGFPTANLEFDENFVIPGVGVYYTVVELNSKIYRGITSVGYNPTVQTSDNGLTIETYILDFDADIYGKNIKLYFIEKFRDEIKFNSLDELTAQLQADAAYAKKQILEII